MKRRLFFTTLTNALAKLSPDEYRQFAGKKRLKKDLRLKLLENGFLLANVDAREIYTKYRVFFQRPKDYLSVNITASMRCNARCTYCYESGLRRGEFSGKNLEDTLKFILRQHSSGKIRVTWFGGEPLLGQKNMDFISTGLLDANIDFSSYLITNGSLITPELIQEKFPLWKINEIQISLDGSKKTYAKRKRYKTKSKGVFDRVLENIRLCADAGILTHLRLNMDEHNADEMIALLPELQRHFAENSRVVYYPAFLTGVGTSLSAEQRIEIIKKMFTTINDPTKFNMSHRLYAPPRMSACMREDPRSFSIDTSGHVYSCEHLVGRRQEALGTVRRLNQARNNARVNPELRDECKNCVYLPKCMGGCAENMKTDDPCCLIESYMIPAYLEFLAE